MSKTLIEAARNVLRAKYNTPEIKLAAYEQLRNALIWLGDEQDIKEFNDGVAEPPPVNPFKGESAEQKRDRDWTLAIGMACKRLGLEAHVPCMPTVEAFTSFITELEFFKDKKPVIQREGVTMVMDEYESPRAPGYAQGEPTACAMCRRPFSQHDRVIDAKPGERRIACPTPGYARVVIIAESAHWLRRVLSAQKDALTDERHKLLKQRGESTTMYESMLENIELDLTSVNRWLDVLPERPA